MPRTRTKSVSFLVHAVKPETTALPTHKTQEALAALLGTTAEAVCDYTTDCLESVRIHPLIAAAHEAFSRHYPLVLSPDMIWVAILQGLAQHVKNNAEQLRDRFVSHSGRKALTVERDDFVPGSPENPWAEVVAELSAMAQANLASDHAWLEADFSTTGLPERVASQVAILDALQPYFEYRVYCACGIPSITLEGTADDWQRLADKIDQLADYDLDWWLEHLRPIARQFVRASKGDVDLDHWRNIYKRLDIYGGYIANGWLLKLVPYLKNHETNNFTRRNELLAGPFVPYPKTPAVPKPPRDYFPVADEPGVGPRQLPTGVAAAPFTLEFRGRQRQEMEFLGGFLGITQDPKTRALRPKLGWAVRRRSDLDQLLGRVRDHRPGTQLSPPEIDSALHGFREKYHLNVFTALPGDLLSFYKAHDGADLFVDQPGGPVYRIRRLADLVRIEPHWPEGLGEEYRQKGVNPFCWVRFADLADGTFLALNTQFMYTESEQPEDLPPPLGPFTGREVFQVIHCRMDEPDARKAFRVVAWSFGEFLRLALDSGGRVFHDEPGFQDRGDAFTRPRL
jgi:hypothetical protein